MDGSPEAQFHLYQSRITLMHAVYNLNEDGFYFPLNFEMGAKNLGKALSDSGVSNKKLAQVDRILEKAYGFELVSSF